MNIVDPISEMAKIAPARVFVLVPIIGQLERRSAAGLEGFNIALGDNKNKGEAAFFVLIAADFDETHFVAIKIEGFLDIRDAHHRVQIFHHGSSSKNTVTLAARWT